MKKTLTFIFSILILLLSVSVIPAHAAYNNEMDFTSDIVYMESLDKGTVIFNKNSSQKTAMASLTKITTALVVLENCKDLNKQITVSQKVLDTLAGTNSSTAGITAGEQLTIKQLLYLMMVKSANEASSILADYVGGGSIDNFIVMMNDFAKARGCTNTHYVNPHGLDADNHYTTAEDLAKIIKYGLKNEMFCEIVGSPTYTLEQTNKRKTVTYSNTNALLHSYSPYYYEYCKGIKTGTTDNAGQCLASVATKNGYSYLCIIISGPNKETTTSSGGYVNIAFKETKKAYEWAFKNIKLKVVAKPTDVVTSIDVALGKNADHVRLVPKEESTALMPTNVDSSAILIVPIKDSLAKDVKAPIKAGEVLGQAQVMYAEDVLYTIDLVAGEDVNRSFLAYLGYLIKSFFKSTLMKLVFFLFLIVVVVILVLHFISKAKKKQKSIHIVRMNTQKKQPKNNPNHGNLKTTSKQKKFKSQKPNKNMNNKKRQ